MIPIGLRAFLLTFPSINIMICSYLIQYPWLYDHVVRVHGRVFNLVLRNQMKQFVVAFNIFILLIYIIYAFTVPSNSDQKGGRLFDLYTVIMILEIVAVVLVSC